MAYSRSAACNEADLTWILSKARSCLSTTRCETAHFPCQITYLDVAQNYENVATIVWAETFFLKAHKKTRNYNRFQGSQTRRATCTKMSLHPPKVQGDECSAFGSQSPPSIRYPYVQYTPLLFVKVAVPLDSHFSLVKWERFSLTHDSAFWI